MFQVSLCGAEVNVLIGLFPLQHNSPLFPSQPLDKVTRHTASEHSTVNPMHSR
jgi:hypothetical protein